MRTSGLRFQDACFTPVFDVRTSGSPKMNPILVSRSFSLSAHPLLTSTVSKRNIFIQPEPLFFPRYHPTIASMPLTPKKFATTHLGMRTRKRSHEKLLSMPGRVESNGNENERPQKRLRTSHAEKAKLKEDNEHRNARSPKHAGQSAVESANNSQSRTAPDESLENDRCVPFSIARNGNAAHPNSVRSKRAVRTRETRSITQRDQQKCGRGPYRRARSRSSKPPIRAGANTDNIGNVGRSEKVGTTGKTGELVNEDVTSRAVEEPSSNPELHLGRRYPKRRGSPTADDDEITPSGSKAEEKGEAVRASSPERSARNELNVRIGKDGSRAQFDRSIDASHLSPASSTIEIHGRRDNENELEHRGVLGEGDARMVRSTGEAFERRNRTTFTRRNGRRESIRADQIHSPIRVDQRRYPVRRTPACTSHDGRNDRSSHYEDEEEASIGGRERIGEALMGESDPEEFTVGSFDARGTNRSVGMVKETRAYNYVKRVRAVPRPPSDLSKRRSARADEVQSVDFASWDCCKKLKCFRQVNMDYFKAQRSTFLRASQSDRKQSLANMLKEDNKFYFNHRVVCTYFLSWGFGFSKDLQRTVKGTARAPATTLIKRSQKSTCKADQRDFILSFLDSMATSTADHMPDTPELHLPFHQKKHVYDLFCESFTKYPVLGVMREPPSFSYFVRMWNDRRKNLKVRAVKRFTKCTECESTRMALAAAAKENSETSGILAIRRRHLEFIQNERTSYVTRAQMAVTNPMKVCSIVVDGADQSNFGLPHFTSNTKDTRGEALKVKLVGLLEHGSTKSLFLYTMTTQFETGANHVVECVHRWLNKKAVKYGLPPALFVQLDNCSRENKNRFLFSYLECLVAWGVFEEVQASFLPVGHTHSDIDQTFSCTSRRLKVNDAVTMSDLHEQLRKSFTPAPSVCALLHVANFSGLVNSSACLESLPAFSHYRFFRFARRSGKPRIGSGRYNTTCSVKESCDGEWDHFSKEHGSGFLKFAPDLSMTPKTVLTSPDNGVSVTERIDSEEGRINNDKKVQDLRNLRDEVYRCKEDPFHWNLECSVEMKAAKGEELKRPGSEESIPPSHIPHTRVSYDLNSFVIVRPLPSTRECPFWLAQVLEQKRNSGGDVYEITVRWYEVKGNQTVFDGRYEPSFRDDKDGRSIPWIEDISTDTVMFNFPSLTYHKNIGRTVVRRLQAALHSQP